MLIYIAIAAGGLIILLAMLVLGDLFGGDHDLAHDVGHGETDHGGPSAFSVRIMASFLTAFGVGGVIARHFGLSHVAASGVGIVCGLVMSTVVYQFARVLYSQQASSELHMGGLVGVEGEVSVAIPSGGVGQVAVNTAGARSEHIARSSDASAIARGTAVVITGLGGDSVIVARASGNRQRS